MKARPSARRALSGADRAPRGYAKKKTKRIFSSGDGILKNNFLKHLIEKTNKFIAGNLPSDELGGLMLSVVIGKPETPGRHVTQRADGQAGGPKERQAFKPSPQTLDSLSRA